MQGKIHVSEVGLWPKITPDRHHPSKGAVVSRCPGQNAKDTHQNHQSWPLPATTVYSRVDGQRRQRSENRRIQQRRETPNRALAPAYPTLLACIFRFFGIKTSASAVVAILL